MTEIEVINEREKIVRKSNDLIQNSRYNMPVQQQKLLLHLISKISPFDEEFKEFEFSIIEFCRVCGINYRSSQYYQEIKDALFSLSMPICWITKENGAETPVSWIVKPEVSKRGGTIKVKFDEDMRPYLLQLKQNFTQYNLIYTLLFKSKYSVRLYELIKSVHFHELEDYTRRYSLEELRSVLLPKPEKKKSKKRNEEYQNFKDFKKRVLIPAVNEINEYSDKTVEAVQIYEGKKVTAIEFNIKTKRTLEQLDLRDKINKMLDGADENQISFTELQIEEE